MKKVVFSVTKQGRYENTKMTGVGYITGTDLIIACGPPVMLRALKTQLKEKGITTPCLVSLEERMGCGIGACLVCVCKKSDGSNARVCKDGPVFDIDEVEL